MAMIKHWISAVRPKTLPASISPIILGSSIAFSVDQFSAVIFLSALICALFLQITVNLANDYFDAKSGVDTNKRIGPKRVTQSGVISEIRMRLAIAVSCSVSIISGLTVAFLSDPVLIVFGGLSIAALFAYSAGPFPLASHGLGEITVFLFFGLLAVAGTFFAHVKYIELSVLFYGAAVGTMSAAIMLVNNIRDIATDKAAGKNTLAVKLGDKQSRNLYVLFLSLAIIFHLLASWNHGLVIWLSLIIIAPFLLLLVKGIFHRVGTELNKQLAKTAQLLFTYSVSTSFSVIIF